MCHCTCCGASAAQTLQIGDLNAGAIAIVIVGDANIVIAVAWATQVGGRRPLTCLHTEAWTKYVDFPNDLKAWPGMSDRIAVQRSLSFCFSWFQNRGSRFLARQV